MHRRGTAVEDLDPDDKAELLANIALIGQTGAKGFQIGYDERPVAGPFGQRVHLWTATAQYAGARVSSQGQNYTPMTAAHSLAQQLLGGAQCTGCRKLIALAEGGAMWRPGSRNLDGTPFTFEQAQQRGTCQWQREGEKWNRGCGPEVPADSTRERLAVALAVANVPTSVIRRARAGEFDDYLSDDPFALLTLATELEQNGYNELAQRVRDGEFDGTKAEADAWAASSEGKLAIAEVFGGPWSAEPPAGNRAERRRKARRKPK